MFGAAGTVASLNGGVVNKESLWPRAIGAVAVIALVLVTNECYRHVRALVDAVAQSKHDIAVLKRDLYVLQVQLDNQPTNPQTPAVAVAVAPDSMPAPTASPLTFPPMPAPIGPVLPLPDPPARPRPKLQPSDEGKSVETKSLLSVVLMSDAKAIAPASPGASTKPQDGAKLDVHLIGEAK
jgi:hypothetical protein